MREERAQIILETPAVSLRYYPVSKIVHHEFKQFARGDDFRGVLENGLLCFRKHGAFKWLSDDRGNSAVTPADADWALNDWAPRVIAAGWKFWAVVMPENVIGQMNMKRWVQTYLDKGIHTQVFASPVEALRWLRAQ
jgi:hypothetical protein